MPRWALGLVVALLAIAADPILPGSAAADLAIERKCQLDWPDNYSRRAWCERNQRRGVRELLDYDVGVSWWVTGLRRARGTLRLDGEEGLSRRGWARHSAVARARGIVHLPEDRHGRGLCLPLTVEENLALGWHVRAP